MKERHQMMTGFSKKKATRNHKARTFIEQEESVKDDDSFDKMKEEELRYFT